MEINNLYDVWRELEPDRSDQSSTEEVVEIGPEDGPKSSYVRRTSTHITSVQPIIAAGLVECDYSDDIMGSAVFPDQVNIAVGTGVDRLAEALGKFVIVRLFGTMGLKEARCIEVIITGGHDDEQFNINISADTGTSMRVRGRLLDSIERDADGRLLCELKPAQRTDDDVCILQLPSVDADDKVRILTRTPANVPQETAEGVIKAVIGWYRSVVEAASAGEHGE